MVVFFRVEENLWGFQWAAYRVRVHPLCEFVRRSGCNFQRGFVEEIQFGIPMVLNFLLCSDAYVPLGIQGAMV